jgi:hypothetical protein
MIILLLSFDYRSQFQLNFIYFLFLNKWMYSRWISSVVFVVVDTLH